VGTHPTSAVNLGARNVQALSGYIRRARRVHRLILDQKSTKRIHLVVNAVKPLQHMKKKTLHTKKYTFSSRDMAPFPVKIGTYTDAGQISKKGKRSHSEIM
jgi:hypothetical protein